MKRRELTWIGNSIRISHKESKNKYIPLIKGQFPMMQKAFLLTMIFAIDIYSTSLYQEKNKLQLPDGRQFMV